ncbi:MAG TPA: GAF domain-containing SpoIIE family protein phosphatase [Bacteroidota bacterium]|jgi:sigma-B regulation protein RsbU (phosphoserine phosphatase)|nr:GAF domain-containing SpoIIE family protein phosphatase [Bacteroidota bacterium]
MEQLAQLQEENQRLRKAVEELSILNELARVISSTMNLDSVIENVVKRSVRAVHGQQGMITLVDEQAPTEMKTLIRAQSTSDHQQFHLNQNVLGWMMINKKPLLSNDITNDSRFSGVRSEGDQRSLLCVPLLVKNRLVGILAVFNKKDSSEFTQDDQRLLSIIAAQSGQILENARLYETEKSLITMQEQVKLASKIQTDLLPKKPPAINGYEIAGKSIPAQLVGGDLFDFIPVDNHKMAVVLGDVSGKGLPASLLMSNTQATLRGQTLLATSARECIERSNTLLYQSTSDEKFVTLFYGILDFEQHQLRFCNAGHDNPYWLSEGKEARRLKTGGIVLSVMESFPYEEEIISLEPGDMLVIYSDGIPEAMNSNQELFSDARLGTLLKECRNLSASDVITKVVAAAKSHAGTWPQSDDMTMVVIRRLAG